MSPPGPSVMIARRGEGEHSRCRGRRRAPRRAASAGRGRAGAARRGCFASTARSGARFVAGADEAGRGLAGGAAGRRRRADRLREPGPSGSPRALAISTTRRCARPEEREELYPFVLRAASRVAVTVRCVRGIDARGLHVTNLAALARSLERVAVPGAVCLVDGFSVPSCSVEHRAVIDGDATSAAIAAASVIAKVTRDRYMCQRRPRLSAVRLRRQRRLLDPGAPRGDHRARPLGAFTAAPSSRSPTASSSWRAA